MSRPDLLSQLPSLEELLEHPRVAKAIDQLNRSTAASQLRTAISGLGAEITRRAESLQATAPSELIDRLLNRLGPATSPAASPVINATGRLFGPPPLRPPLAAVAIDAATKASQGFSPVVAGQAAVVASRLLRCDAARVASSHVSAMSITLEALAGGGVGVVARGDLSELAPGVRLDQIARRGGVTVREVGATDTVSLDDYDAALSAAASEGSKPLLLLRRPAANSAAPTVHELAGLAAKHGAALLVDAGRARPTDATPRYGSETPSIEEQLAAGADIVIADAAGLIGGPHAGLIVGKQATIDLIRSSSAAAAATIDPAIDASLAATLECFERPEELRFTHPLYQLLDAPLENLRLRAERLATQLAAIDGIQNATACESHETLASWTVRLEADAVQRPGFAKRLVEHDPRVLFTETEGALVLDLKAVFPAQDASLLQAFGSATTQEAEDR